MLFRLTKKTRIGLISLVLGVVLILITIVYYYYLQQRTDDSDVVTPLAAEANIYNAYNGIMVRHPAFQGMPAGSSKLMETLNFSGPISKLTVDIDFKHALSNVGKRDFVLTRGVYSEFSSKLQEDVATLFNLTNDLVINVCNNEALDEYSFFDGDGTERKLSEILEEETRFIEFPLPISYLIGNGDSNSLSVTTGFGSLNIHSDFFKNLDPLLSCDDEENGFNPSFDSQNVVFDYSDGDLVVEIRYSDESVNYIHNPWKSLMLTIPLNLDFMRNPVTGNTYNAVQFISNDNGNEGVLPRSFTNGGKLYIFSNRTGTFRLCRTDNGENNIPGFLQDRGINIKPINGEVDMDGEIVNIENGVRRIDFYVSLLHTFMMERIDFYSLPGDKGFIDVTDEELNNLMVIAKQRGLLTGFDSVNPDQPNEFKPDWPLRRRDLIVMLANFIKHFDPNVTDLFSFDPDAVGSPSYSERNDPKYEYWYDHLRFLENEGCIPYRIIDDDSKDVAGEDFATVKECQNILYKMITNEKY